MESIFYIGLRKSTGQSQNRCVQVMECHRDSKRAEKEQSLLDSESLSMGVLSDDFAAVDFREELCYHSRPKKQIQEVNGTAKPIMRKLCAAEKAAADPQSGSAGTAPRRRAFGLVFRVVLVVFFVACAWLRRASARRTCHRQAHAMVPILIANEFFSEKDLLSENVRAIISMILDFTMSD